MAPEGWTRTVLGQIVAHLGRGTSPKYADRPTPILAVNQKCVRNGRVTVEHARPHEPSAPVKPASVLRPGDLCVNSTGTGTIGRVGLWEPRDGTHFVDTHVTVVRPDAARVVPKFLCESLLAPWTQKEMEVTCFTGSTNQIELSKSAFAELALLLPPLREQRKIAAILSSMDDAIEATQAVIDQLQVVKKAMMAELLTRGLPGRHTRFKMTELGEVPEEWEVVPFERVLAEGDSLSYGILQPGDDDPTGINMLRTVDLDEQGGRSETTILRVSRAVEAPYQRTRLRGGEVLISVMGTVGRTVVVPPEWAGWNVNRALAVVRVNEAVTPDFLSFWLRSPSTQERFAAEQIGSAQKRINLGDLRKMLVPVPGGDEQSKLCEAFSGVDQRDACEVRTLTYLRSAKSALISVLLTGEVRVKPDEEAA